MEISVLNYLLKIKDKELITTFYKERELIYYSLAKPINIYLFKDCFILQDLSGTKNIEEIAYKNFKECLNEAKKRVCIERKNCKSYTLENLKNDLLSIKKIATGFIGCDLEFLKRSV